jgi:hypothetical protein
MVVVGGEQCAPADEERRTMLGFIIGTACLIGLIRTIRHGRCGRGGYGHGGRCGGGRCGDERGHGPWGHRGGGRRDDGSALRFMLRPLFERLETTPGQERVILDAAEALRARVAASKDALRSTASDAAKAFRGERFDEGVMGESFAKQDEALEATQKAVFEALQKVHDALDERQRRDFADHIERFTGAAGRWGQGPYRA